jgi:hypothetical protein
MTTNKTDWYWINGSAYCPACVACDIPAIDSAEATLAPCESGRCACCGTPAQRHDREYQIALVMADGEWEVIDTFAASDDDAANAYAEEHHADRDWYVLDAGGRNINGGDQE